jgi:hypothetical protein
VPDRHGDYTAAVAAVRHRQLLSYSYSYPHSPLRERDKSLDST